MYIYRSILQYESRCHKFRVYRILCVIFPFFIYKNLSYFHELEMYIFVTTAAQEGEGV
jgi:hypothetical protein